MSSLDSFALSDITVAYSLYTPFKTIEGIPAGTAPTYGLALVSLAPSSRRHRLYNHTKTHVNIYFMIFKL